MTASGLPVKSTVVQASAGSGKTFALSNHYLRLLVSGVPCDAILATTFTRKAAGEILDRIMQRLNAAALSNRNCKRLSAELEIELTRDRVIHTLRELSSKLDRLQVGTLDSFFGTLARAFGFELKFPADWQVVEAGQLQQLNDIALERVLGDSDIRQFVYMISRFNAERRVASLVAEQTASLYEIFRTSTPEAWQVIPWHKHDTENAARAIAEEFAGLQVENNSLQKAIDKDLDAAMSGDFEILSSSSRLKAVLNDELTYYRKPLDPTVIQFYRRLGEVVGDHVTQEHARRTYSASRILQKFSEEIWPLKLSAATFQFSDVPFELAGLFSSMEHLELDFRTDQQIDHLLLDEFQDTAPVQWRIIAPIARQILERKRPGTFFCVGDKKQAIFAWRGGVSQIFDVVEKELGDFLSPAPVLAKSWRSSPIVIDVVNECFANLNRSENGREPDRAVLTEWMREFPPHTTARETLDGWVRIERPCKSEDGASPKEAVYAATVAAIERLHRNAPDKSIGVLVSSHENITRILYELHRIGIPASAEGGHSLDDSAAVNLMQSVLKFIDHPGDDIVRFHLSHSPLAEVFGLKPEDFTTQESNRGVAGAIASRLRRQLSQSGFGPFVERHAGILGAHCTSRELRRLNLFIEFAFEYDEPWTCRTNAFLEALAQAKIVDPTADKVRVMTVHAAKGLEFDAVIAPLFDRSRWSAATPPLIYSRTDPGKPIDLVFMYLAKEHRLFLPPRLQEAFDTYEAQEIREELCGLYVLMTRAIHHLQLIMLPNVARGKAGVSSLLLDVLDPADRAADSEVIYEAGNRDWFQEPDRSARPESDHAEDVSEHADEQRYMLHAATLVGP